MTEKKFTGTRRTREDLSSTSSAESATASPEAKFQRTMADNDDRPTIESIYSILKDVQRNTNRLVTDNLKLRKDLDEVRDSLSFQNTLVEELRKENKEIKAQVQDHKRLLELCEVQLRRAETKSEELEDKYDNLEMYTRKYNLEIQGVPEEDEEDLEEIVCKVAECVGVEMDEDSIDIVHRLKVKLNGIRPIIVKFKSHKIKSDIYMSRMKLRGITSFGESLNNAEAIYINENLTPSKRKMYAEIRKRAKQYRWHKVWTLDGKMFVCKVKGERAIKISSYSDLEDIYN